MNEVGVIGEICEMPTIFEIDKMVEHVSCPASCVTGHVSHVMCYLSHVIFFYKVVELVD